MLKHFGLALVISFALSIAFWVVFDIFELIAFFVVSIACAVAGAAIGVAFRRSLVLTSIATAAIRIAVFFVITNI